MGKRDMTPFKMTVAALALVLGSAAAQAATIDTATIDMVEAPTGFFVPNASENFNPFYLRGKD